MSLKLLNDDIVNYLHCGNVWFLQHPLLCPILNLLKIATCMGNVPFDNAAIESVIPLPAK